MEHTDLSRRSLIASGGAALAGLTVLRGTEAWWAEPAAAAAPVPPPRIITARKLGLTFVNRFGNLGPEYNVTGHYSGTARAKDWEVGVSRARAFHSYHRSKNWGGIGYHFVIPDDGTLICARPTILKGTHVGGHNTRNLGINMPGTTGDRPTKAQQLTYRWLLRNAHTEKLPKVHRTDVDLRTARIWGHKEWAGQSTLCPGLFLPMFKFGLKSPLVFPKAPADQQALGGPEEAYPEPVVVRGIEADHAHVSPEEAAAALPPGEEWLPEADPNFDEEAAARGADVRPSRRAR